MKKKLGGGVGGGAVLPYGLCLEFRPQKPEMSQQKFL